MSEVRSYLLLALSSSHCRRFTAQPSIVWWRSAASTTIVATAGERRTATTAAVANAAVPSVRSEVRARRLFKGGLWRDRAGTLMEKRELLTIVLQGAMRVPSIGRYSLHPGASAPG